MVDKVTAEGNHSVLVTERGVSFGYNNLVVDMRAFPMLRELGYPVVFDVTHSLQLPGAGDGVTAGLARVHRAAGIGRRGRRRRCGVHGGPRGARDAPRATPPTRCAWTSSKRLMLKLTRIDAAARNLPAPQSKPHASHGVTM